MLERMLCFIFDLIVCGLPMSSHDLHSNSSAQFQFTHSYKKMSGINHEDVLELECKATTSNYNVSANGIKQIKVIVKINIHSEFVTSQNNV